MMVSKQIGGFDGSENDNKLNFDQPILSVRRYVPRVSSRRREERKTDDYQPVIPRLHPYRSELKSGPVRNPGAVPFVWEQTPGQPKQDVKPPAENTNATPSTVSKLFPPGRLPKSNHQGTSGNNKRLDVDVRRESHRGPTHDENVKNIESNKETEEEEDEEESSDDEAYVDALDALSRTESFFLNCSMSVVSGLEDLHTNNPSRSPSTDVQAREFMMDRFLPAAKAMASGTPQYVTKKQPRVVEEQLQQLKKTANRYKPSLRYGPSFAEQYSHYQENEDEESDDDYDKRQNFPSVCGLLLPRFCLRNSLCLLNTRSSLAGEIQNESRSGGAELKFDQIQTTERGDGRAKLESNKCGRLESHSTPTHADALLPSVEDKEVLAITEVKMHAGAEGFRAYEKGFKKVLFADQGSSKESNLGSNVIKKTLHVDTVRKIESPNLRHFSHNKHDSDGVPSSREEDHEIITKKLDQMDSTDSSLEDNKLKTINREEKLPSKAGKFGAFSIFSSTDKLTEKSRMKFSKAFAENQVFWPDSTTTENIQVAEKEASEGLEKQISRASTVEHTHPDYTRPHAPPPLPKSPSDSWLWRTLPSMSTKSSSPHSYLSAATNPRNQCSMANTSDIKWETTVKTASVQRSHMHYSDVRIIDNNTINFKKGLSEVTWLIQKQYFSTPLARWIWIWSLPFLSFLLDSNELVTIL
ncbi:hypothetical protein OROGR_012272 [Orobanche gracilis]